MFPVGSASRTSSRSKSPTCCLALLQLVIERAAAVVGNLSTTDHFFSAIREAGAIQRLVRLLDSGSTHRTTEIAAKTLANLASESSNRKGIWLAGGIPPLMRLLMDRPSEQVSILVVVMAVLMSQTCTVVTLVIVLEGVAETVTAYAPYLCLSSGAAVRYQWSYQRARPSSLLWLCAHCRNSY